VTTAYITEFTAQAGPGGALSQTPAMPKQAGQTVAIGGSSAQSNAFSSSTNLIRVHTDSICSVEIGSNPIATTASQRMAANQTEYFQVQPGQKLACITNT
jgi:hypothetical protein